MCFLFLLQYLSRCVVGASLEEPEEEDDARSTSSSIIMQPKEGCYEVVGTVKDPETTKLETVKEIIKVSHHCLQIMIKLNFNEIFVLCLTLSCMKLYFIL